MSARSQASDSVPSSALPLQGEGDSYNEAQLRAILETCVEGIITIDEGGIVESFNPSAERIFGYPANEVIGNNVNLLMPSPDRERHDAYLAHYLETGEQQIIGVGREVVGRRKDGSLFPVHLSVSEVRHGDRRIFTGFLHDLTQRHEYEAKLIQSERLAALGEAMAGLAHESRNALQRIQIAAEMLDDYVGDDSEAAEFVRVIERAQSDVHRLFQEVREYATPILLAYEDVRLDGGVRRAWNDLNAERQGRQAKLVEEVQSTDLQLDADPFSLVQVFRNILENSLAACEDPVEIRVTYSEVQLGGREALMVQICDNGPGLSAEACDRAFDSFFTTKTKGTGLGLAISKRIVEAHEGTIAVNRNSPHGAAFAVTLPRRKP